MLVLHPDHPPAPHDLWQAWSFEPAVLLGLAIVTIWYLQGVRVLWRRAGRGRGVTRRQVGAFLGGVAALVVALVTPLDRLGTALFSAHMVQHLVLTLAAAPLLVLGVPGIAMLWALPPAARRGVGAWWRRATGLRRIWRALTYPAVAWGLSTVALWIWHLPSLYQSALRSEGVHMLEHASFFGTALLFWWALARPDRRRRLRFGADVLYLFTAAMQSGVLGALITFARTAWYPIHTDPAASWGLTALQDQQLAGLIMWVPASIVYLGATAAIFVRGMARLDRVTAFAARSAAAVLVVLLVTGCRETGTRSVIVGGDPGRGKSALAGFGCGACHTIPGVRGANGMVGPPLTNFASRAYIAGQLPNQPDNLIRWIQDPQGVEPGTAMPNLGVVPAVARDMAAYLYTLR